MVIQYQDWQVKLLEEVELECLDDDRVARYFTYKSFASKSKGGCRNRMVRAKSGKLYGPYPHYGPYKRKHWQDIELVRYQDGKFHLWDRFPFDEYARECLPGWDDWIAIDHIKESLRRRRK